MWLEKLRSPISLKYYRGLASDEEVTKEEASSTQLSCRGGSYQSSCIDEITGEIRCRQQRSDFL